ncbi:MAG: acetamidase/formamidase family protein [Spirochaetes bacterium]|nr:acetamidase/formamidase family protein [Spirochaetota bacterium]
MSNTVIANKFTNGILDPAGEMLGPISSGGRIVAHTAPGCWGPMLTPQLCGGHEVTLPVFVEGAEPGDAVALTVESIVIASAATASGTDKAIDGRFSGDPFVAKKCPKCGQESPANEVKGAGGDAIVCKACGAPAATFEMPNGYTMVFDSERSIGVTVNEGAAAKIAADAWNVMQIPENSVQNPVVLLKKSDLQGVATRTKPFLGQLGTTPPLAFPDSHNAGDFGEFLVGAGHAYAKTREELAQRTDGHLDINKMRQGATVVCPVKVKGAGVYMGDAHAMQSDGEIAGHTCDISAVAVVRVDLIKNLKLDGPVILQHPDDLPFLAKPLSMEEKRKADSLAASYGCGEAEESLPLSFVGTGVNLNLAIDNGISRASGFLGISEDEVKNRVTISGAIEIGRAPGVVTVTLRVPLKLLKNEALAQMLKAKYGG